MTNSEKLASLCRVVALLDAVATVGQEAIDLYERTTETSVERDKTIYVIARSLNALGGIGQRIDKEATEVREALRLVNGY